MPQGLGLTQPRKVKTMQPVNQPSVEASAAIHDGEDFAGSGIDLSDANVATR
jgi:hypothetical protein